jgi:hypothetical protein
MGSASERRNGVKQSGSRTIREPTWYFQSKLLVSYKAQGYHEQDKVSMKKAETR